MEIAHHIHGDDGRAKAMKVDQDVAEGQDPEYEPAVTKGFVEKTVCPATIGGRR